MSAAEWLGEGTALREIEPGIDSALLCPGILHLFERLEAVLARLSEVLRPGGRLFASALVTDRRFGGWFLRGMARSGELGCLLSLEVLCARAERTTGLAFDGRVHGNTASVWSRAS